MATNRSGSSGVGLERSCEPEAPDRILSSGPVGGVELLEARLRRLGYRRHRHDTYAVSLTESGVQAFTYRGAAHASTPGQVVVLHPDEPHDGRAGTEAGFAYRQLYVEPALISEAVRSLRGHPGPLPFVRPAVAPNPALAAAIRSAFLSAPEPLALDDLVVRVAAGLLAADASGSRVPLPRRFDPIAIGRARQFLDAETTRVVPSSELEGVTGLSRYELARQFRAAMGVSPYRYSLMRRLAFARARIAERRELADVAADAGFADQAHFTRRFTAAFGMTPGQYRSLMAHEPALGKLFPTAGRS